MELFISLSNDDLYSDLWKVTCILDLLVLPTLCFTRTILFFKDYFCYLILHNEFSCGYHSNRARN